MLLHFPSQRSRDSLQKKNSVAKHCLKRFWLLLINPQGAVLRVKEMEDIARLMADYMGMMRSSTSFLFRSNTVFV